MNKERVVLSFTAAALGLLVAGIAFYLYQSTKTISPSKLRAIPIVSLSPTPAPSIFLSIDKPKDEEVFDKKIITVLGKTTADATIVVITDTDQEVITPALNGDFSTTVTINDGGNIIEITAIAPNGEETSVKRTVSFSTASF